MHKIHEKHKFMDKIRISWLHNETYKKTHKYKWINITKITWIHWIHDQIYEKTNKYIRLSVKKIKIVPRVCSSSMFRVCWCVLWLVSLLLDYMCVRLPSVPWSIAGVPSRQAFPGYLITAPPSGRVPAVLGALAVWIQKSQKKKTSSW